MEKNNIICNNCGTACPPDSTYCPNCSASFIINDDPFFGEQVIEGIENKDVEAFVDYHHKYYTHKFNKVRHKKFFLQINIPALIFGQYWYAFRKMYKLAALFTVIAILISALMTVFIPIVFYDRVEEYKAANQAVGEYIDNGGVKTVKTGPNVSDTKTHPTYLKLITRQDDAKASLRAMHIWTFIPSIVFAIVIRFCANYFYRNRVRRYAGVDNSKGGTKFWMAVLFIGIVDIATTTLGFLVLFIPQVFEFYTIITKIGFLY